MKILISPSKTKVLQGQGQGPLFHEEITNKIVTHMQGLSVADIGKMLKIKEDKAMDVHSFFLHYEEMPEGMAATSYSGLAFKNLDWQGLSDQGQAFGEAHLVILSAFYGIVEPLSGVKDYRLDFVDPILKKEKTSLYEWWDESINAYLAQEDWILNLASKEYSKIVRHPHMVTVEFVEYKNGQWKQMSTSSKQMRGRLAHYVLDHQVTQVDALPEELTEFVKYVEPTDPKLIQYRKK